MRSLLVVGFLALPFGAMGQGPAVTDEPPKTVPKKVEPKKAEPKKVDTTKAVAPKKPAAPKKTTAPAATRKPAAPAKTTVYTNDPKAPVLRDKQGNVIPTNPDAYDVSSAVGPKK